MAKFSLAWVSHKDNICNGLTALQQNGEFVDMTLAADGHHVKVHQLVISLASPYLKEIITSIQNPHPIIFLNKISYPILSAILEYIYTGEVLIEKENLSELIEAAKDLHIKGLQDMDMKCKINTSETLPKSIITQSSQGQPLTDYKAKAEQNPFSESEAEQTYEMDIVGVEPMDSDPEDPNQSNIETSTTNSCIQTVSDSKAHIQYTISNQGVIQMILNRCLYYLRYTSRAQSGHRQWRCIDYATKTKCPACVITKQDVVVKRIAAHNHPFHDKKILKKVRDNSVYSAIQDAEAFGLSVKQSREKL